MGYTGSNSKVGFGKETPRKGSPERMTIAERQGMSEEDHFEEKSMLRKPTFELRAVYFGGLNLWQSSCSVAPLKK